VSKFTDILMPVKLLIVVNNYGISFGVNGHLGVLDEILFVVGK